MTFDSRARRAVRGIHRAVEVMEMSDTKTPQKLVRFDQYRENKTRNRRIAAIAVGIAVPVALLIGVARLQVMDRDLDVPGSTPSVSVTPTLVSGHSEQFETPFTYTVPQDWTFSGEGARYFGWDASDGSHLILLSNVVANAPDCSDRPQQGVGTSSDAITSWLSADPALDATTPRPVRLGAATGSYVDIQLAERGIRKNCPNGLGLVVGVTGLPRPGWSIGGSDKVRLYVLDLPSGDTVTIVVDTYSQASGFRYSIEQATPVVESFRFLR